MMRHFAEVEPIYRSADELVRQRIKKDILRLLADMDGNATISAIAPSGP